MATSIQVDKFATPHGKGEGGGGGTTIIMGGKNGSVPANLNVNTINATTGNIQNLTGRSMTFNDASFIYLVSENGTISKLNGNDLKYENGVISNLTSDSIETGKLKASDIEATNATIDNIISKNITTEYLTVTKQAHFFELVIDKIKSVGGQIILTPASCIADYVIPDSENTMPLYYDVYFRATDEVNREITNDWQVDDQAICQNFNNARTGHSYNVQNKYYWRLVTGILDDVYINFRTGETLPYNTSEAHDYTSAHIWNICLSVNDVNTGNNIDYKTSFDDDPYYPADPGGQDTKRSLLDNIDIAPMELNGHSMAGWTNMESDSENPMVGEMKTYNNIFGIQITPKEGYQLNGAILNKIELSTADDTRLNIGVYFDDNSSQYFPAPLNSTRHYEYDVNANANIEAIIITNSDEPDWHLCHGIRLGNDNSDHDDKQVDVNYNPNSQTTPSEPGPGDNIIQLGYRFHKYPESDSRYDIRRSSAIIISAYHTPDTGINPPSYAQYKKINDFNLSSHRHTYFDADGSKFYGNFYVGPDSDDTSDYVPITDLEAEVYKIIPDYDIITKDVNGDITPGTLKCRFMVPNQSQLSDTVPTGCTFKYWKDNSSSSTTITSGQVNINISDIQDNIILQLLKDGAILDQITKAVVEIDVANGIRGSWTQWIYRNVAKGTTPSIAASWNGTASIPTGWSETSTPPATDYYTWFSTRVISYNQSNSPIYGNWTTPSKLTGDDGQAGTDGKYTEFIYRRFSQIPTWTNNNLNPSYWAANDTEDYLGLAYSVSYSDSPNNKWTDNPRGVNSTYQYEYVSSREFDGEHFGQFNTPALWSKWGEKGQDGDGYEYIYKLADSTPGRPVAPHGDNRDEDYPSDWSDDPLGVTALTGQTKEWVSMRKKTTGVWGSYSSPALWAQYVPQGTQGPVGPQGRNGTDGRDGQDGVSPIEYRLVDCDSTANVAMRLDSSNNITQTLNMNLKFRILRCEGNDSRYLNANEINGKYVYYRMSKSTGTTPSYYYYRLTLATSGYNIAEFTASLTNTNTNIITANNNIIVALIQNSATSFADQYITNYSVYDTTNISITLQSAAMTQVVQGQNASIRNLVTGQQGINSNISDLYQTMNGIQSTVTSINSNYVNQSQLSQTANQIKTEVINEVSDEFNATFETIADLTGLNNNYWYPVSITLQPNVGDAQRIVIDRELLSELGTGQSYSNHDRGFVCVVDWTTVWCGWGTNWNRGSESVGGTWYANECNGYDKDTYRFIHKYDTLWTKVVNGIPENYIAGSIRQNYCVGEEIICLRGGSKYKIQTGWDGTVVTVHRSGYSNSYGEQHTLNVITYYGALILPQVDQMKRSEIIQTADSITMRVNDVNTRLDNGGFTINANTTINGQLTINNSSEQGFIVTGDNGNTSILSKSIGTYNNFKNTATKWILANGSVSHAYWSTSSHSYTTSTNISLGNVKNSTTLRFRSFSCSAHKSNSGDNYSVGSWSGTIQIYNGSSLVKTISNITSSTGEQSYTTTSEGTYSLKLSWSINSLTMNGQSVSSATIDTSFAMYTFIPSGTYTLIGYDGIASNFGNDNTVFFGNEGTYIRYTDDNVLRVNANGIEKYCNGTTGGGSDYYVSNWSPINGCCVRKIGSSGNYNLKKFEDMIVVNITSGTANIYLGTPGNNKGRRIYVKKMRGGCRIYGYASGGSGNYIIPNDGDYDDTSQYRDQNERIRIYISDGTYWYEGYF